MKVFQEQRYWWVLLLLNATSPSSLQVRNPGEPGSKPFPGYTTSSDSFRAALTPLHKLPTLPADQSLKREVAPNSGDLQSAESSESFRVDSDGKIRPKVRTRFRSKATPVINNANRLARPRKKKTGKIVLKRRKVKKLRNRPKKRPPVSEVVRNEGVRDSFGRGGGGGGGSAPEANRGRPLAELAFATLSREEQTEEERNVFGTPRWEFVPHTCYCIVSFQVP